MKHSIFQFAILIFLLIPHLSYGQFTSELYGYYNKVTIHNENGTIKGGLNSLEFVISKPSAGGKKWHHIQNFPNQGLSFRLKTYGNPDTIGYSISAVPYLEFIFFRDKKVQLEVKHGTGLALFTQHFQKSVNENNQFISTHLNVETFLNAGLAFPISPRISTKIGGEFSHMSNGKLSLPNKGINTLSFYVGLKYFPSGTKRNQTDKIKYHPGQRWYQIPAFHIGLSARRVESNAIRADKDISLDIAYQHNARFRSSIGPGFVQINRPGFRNRSYVAFAEEVMIGQLSTKYSLGAYLDREGAPTFIKIGLNYYPFSKGSTVASGLFIGAHLKSHGFVAENVEFNVGYVF